MFDNFKKIFKNPKYLISYLLMVFVLAFIWYKYTSFESMYWGYGKFRFYLDLLISWINILGFPLFILAWIYRSYNLGLYSNKWDSFGFLWGFISIVISGSLCCGSSLLIPLGASIFVDFFSKNFPYWWLELKILWVLILIYWIFNLFKNLTVCKMKKNKNPK